jgi:hypothetical protein
MDTKMTNDKTVTTSANSILTNIEKQALATKTLVTAKSASGKLMDFFGTITSKAFGLRELFESFFLSESTQDSAEHIRQILDVLMSKWFGLLFQISSLKNISIGIEVGYDNKGKLTTYYSVKTASALEIDSRLHLKRGSAQCEGYREASKANRAVLDTTVEAIEKRDTIILNLAQSKFSDVMKKAYDEAIVSVFQGVLENKIKQFSSYTDSFELKLSGHSTLEVIVLNKANVIDASILLKNLQARLTELKVIQAKPKATPRAQPTPKGITENAQNAQA